MPQPGEIPSWAEFFRVFEKRMDNVDEQFKDVRTDASAQWKEINALNFKLEGLLSIKNGTQWVIGLAVVAVFAVAGTVISNHFSVDVTPHVNSLPGSH